ncbi:hypothetical protein BO70DRAFT_427146 [Aspergillus heteromorphus CBS 117.55]|uniref:SWI/SNF family DNA-dependent ATPase Ris1 n=1 Tax=Aspergillus heteromorphus CBS 117.55 TaxID=1448321 RepID=A0A317WT39_9EURO|nr:uncharacterized protein BO70DRAFT_427146 [Aspergillus heteromorphus CBS 117.55]PWY88357.1 hypothetical protein BO70DRAFT_427146 [Aspergillus heteromorphus CBS 117.55]
MLRSILGVDSANIFRDIQEEQKKAEKWLEERREQERRDAEYARQLHESFFQPQPSSSRHIVSSSDPDTPEPSPQRPHQRNSHRPPGPSQLAPPSRSLDPNRSAFLGRLMEARESGLPPGMRDSDDSDVAEITPLDFQRHVQNSPPRTNRYPLPWENGMDNDGLNRPHPSLQPNRHPLDRMNNGPGRSYIMPMPPSRPSLSSAMGRPGTTFSPHVMSSTMARLNSGKDMLAQATRALFGDAGPYQGSSDYPSFDPDYVGQRNYDMAMNRLNDIYGSAEDPKKTQEEIVKLLESIRPDSEISLKDREGTPDALKYPLLEHQKLGLAWMKAMEEGENKGGILADDMGLGKTVQAISLMVTRPSTDPNRKPTLIIAPVALIQQWKREITRMLKPGRHQLSVCVLHGEKKATKFRDLKQYDVVLTTFGTLAAELKRREKYEELEKRDPNLARHYMQDLPCLSPASKWYRVIIDEAQCIKNRNTKSANACCRLNATYRWCMTGTPMMNSVEELHSLIKFLRIRPYCQLENFQRDFVRPLKSGVNSLREKAMLQLQVLLKAVLLRRTKTSKIDGKPILQLPPKVSERVHAVFSEDEQEFYNALETQTQLEVNRYIEAGTMGRNYSNILVLLLRLRQACCHPHLIKDFGVEITAATGELDLIANAKAFAADVVNRLKDNDDYECPICIDAVDNPVIFFPCGHSTCAECFSRISDPAIAVRNGVDGAVEAKCPNCRGRVDPKKITDHLSFKKVHFPDPSTEEEGDGCAAKEDSDDSDSDNSDDDSDDSNQSLSRFIVADDEDEEGTSKRPKAKGKRNGKGKSKTGKKTHTLAQLRKEATRNKKSKLKYLRRLEKSWISSAKIEKAMEILRGIHSGENNEKTIIFSQFTSLLDLLEVPIARQGWDYRRYDGSMKPADRNQAVLDFTDNPDCTIMLVSLKAGNAGLNLVAASQVIIFDPFWNPYVEEQAVDRAHRIGQTRPVVIHRIVVQNTVEDRILELQDKKRELVEGALDEKASRDVSRLGTRELAYLFNIRRE